MLQVARLAPQILSDAAGRVVEFLSGQIHPEGGFRDRAGSPDLYYTVFGLEGLIALRADLPVESTTGYLQRFGSGESLDFVHLASLARCWANLPAAALDDERRLALAARLDTFRAADGGYQTSAGAPHGSAYGAFLALGAHQDLGSSLPDPPALARSLCALRSADGGFSNQPGARHGSTTATAAAVDVLRHLEHPVPQEVTDWLLARWYPEGGFFAAPGTPMPDLLSTATALHALVSLHAGIDHLKDACLDFIDSLWTSRGGFYGHWADDVVDCEYTYYGLLALGHLSLCR
jgi:prenyltransferase beta subunit